MATRTQRGRPGRIGDTPAVRRTLVIAVVAIMILFVAAPVFVVISEAVSAGLGTAFRNLGAPDTRHAIWLTVLTALIAVPINTVFGVAAAWAITKFTFPGRRLLMVVIEIPFSISPIVAGVSYLFVYGLQGLFGEALRDADIRILFALPGIVLASMFVTAPFVARELIPLMQSQGTAQEEAATSLGAGGLRTFFSITLPNIRWALLYGIVLCNARVMGEFGAVSVVSGHVRGQTNTLPLQIQLLYDDYNSAGAFAAASVLTVLAVFTLLAKVLLERRGAGRRLGHSPPAPPIEDVSA